MTSLASDLLMDPLTGTRTVLCLLLLPAMLVCANDIDVTCVVMETCVLPCSFQGDTDAIVHWLYTAGGLNVHSYYHNQDQLANQDQRFRGRTSLFLDQVSGGNASLRLTGLMVQDQGRYSCLTSTVSGTMQLYVVLKVDAPVSKIHVEQVGTTISCSSDGIYPEPELTWSSNPPSSISLSSNTTVQQTKQLLYSISSSLTRPDATDVDYSCTISTSRSKKKSTLRQLTSLSSSSSETFVHCSNSNASLTNFSLVWRFNQSQIILNRTPSQFTVSEQWRQHVKGVSESGSLTLQQLSTRQEGTYSCELSDGEETYVINTYLRIQKGHLLSVSAIVAVVSGASLVLAAAAALLVYYKWKMQTQQQAQDVAMTDTTHERSSTSAPSDLPASPQ